MYQSQIDQDRATPAPFALAFERRTHRPLPAGWFAATLLSSLGLLSVLMAWTGLSVAPFAPPTIAFALFFTVALLVWRHCRAARTERQRVVRDWAEYYGLFIATALMGAIACYPVAALSDGYADAKLQWIDQVLHFDWLAWYGFTAAHPSVQLAGSIVYESIFASPAVILGYFAVQGHRADARWFLGTFWLAAIVTLALYGFMPAKGPFAYLWHESVPYMPRSALYQAELIPQLRQHAVHVVDLAHLRGLVSAPSFHTVSAILFIAAAWPHAKLRWPILVLNVTMLFSTPVEGTHYLSDMLIGAVVAFSALGIMRGAKTQMRTVRLAVA